MRENNRRSNSQQTKFIQINSKNCQACWKCIEACENNVIGKIDLWFHKHSKIKNPENCNGCRKCIKVCEHDAIIALKNERKTA